MFPRLHAHNAPAGAADFRLAALPPGALLLFMEAVNIVLVVDLFVVAREPALVQGVARRTVRRAERGRALRPEAALQAVRGLLALL
jgi:hypothetical protein